MDRIKIKDAATEQGMKPEELVARLREAGIEKTVKGSLSPEEYEKVKVKKSEASVEVVRKDVIIRRRSKPAAAEAPAAPVVEEKAAPAEAAPVEAKAAPAPEKAPKKARSPREAAPVARIVRPARVVTPEPAPAAVVVAPAAPEEKKVEKPVEKAAEKPVQAAAVVVEARAEEPRQDKAVRARKVDVPAEGSLTRPVSSHEFSASFFRLARPALEEKVWLAAEIRDDDIPVLPAGQALFLVDGMENARGVFSLEPGRKELFFGVDQLVSASERNLPVSASPATDEGMTVRRWKKSVDIRNGHDRSVTVRVEAASPIVRDASTQVAFTAEPEAKSGEDGAFRFWNIEVPAKKNSGIVYEVTVTEPDDNASAGNEKN